MNINLIRLMRSLKVISVLLLAVFSTSSVYTQQQQQQQQRPQTKPGVTVTRTDGRIITGTIASQDSVAISIESDSMLISIPISSIASVAYNTNSETTTFQSAHVPAADEILRALRKLVVANDTGVSLVNFGPMLVQAKTDSVEPLRRIGQDTEFARTVNGSLEAYQHAFEAWQNQIKAEFVFSSNDYAKWAIATYSVKKHGLLKTVFFEDVRQAALIRARNYFQKAEALALEMQNSRSQAAASLNSRGSTSTQVSSASTPLVRINQATLIGRWIVEVAAPDSGKRETFRLEIDAPGQSGRVSAFGGASLIESITTDFAAPNLYVVTTKPEKINKKQGQVVMRVRFTSENRLTGMLQLRRLSDGELTPEAPLTAMRTRD